MIRSKGHQPGADDGDVPVGDRIEAPGVDGGGQGQSFVGGRAACRERYHLQAARLAVDAQASASKTPGRLQFRPDGWP